MFWAGTQQLRRMLAVRLRWGAGSALCRRLGRNGRQPAPLPGPPCHTYCEDRLERVGVDALAEDFTALPLRDAGGCRRAGGVAQGALAFISVGLVPALKGCVEDRTWLEGFESIRVAASHQGWQGGGRLPGHVAGVPGR
jgi:hypothetical protein